MDSHKSLTIEATRRNDFIMSLLTIPLPVYILKSNTKSSEDVKIKLFKQNGFALDGT